MVQIVGNLVDEFGLLFAIGVHRHLWLFIDIPVEGRFVANLVAESIVQTLFSNAGSIDHT